MFPRSMVTLAAVGTEQSARSPDDVSSSVTALADRLKDESPERRLLTMISATVLRHQAGWIPPQVDIQPFETATKDVQDICNPRSVRHLKLMLDGHYDAMLPEWLREVAQRQQRVPPEMVPLLLEYGRKKRQLRLLILAVIGERGLWLARAIKNRDWRWFEPHNIDKRWKRASIETRLELLELVRETDPAHACQLILEVWDEETPVNRVEFLRTLGINPHPCDDDLIETALEDDSDIVRHKAAEVGSANIYSSLHGRLREYADPCLGWDGEQIIVYLPETWDVAREHDRIKLQNRRRFEKDAQFWLHQTLERIPLDYWCKKWDISLETLMKGTNTDVANLWNIWASTLLYHPNTEAANLLLRYGYQQMDFAHQTIVTVKTTNQAIEALLVEMLRAERPVHDLHRLLNLLEETWSAELTSLYLDLVSQLCAYDEFRNDREFRSHLQRHAQFINPASKNWYLNIIEQTGTNEREADWQNMVEDIRLILNFRIDMLQALDK